MHLIGAIKKNRLVQPRSERMEVREYFKTLDLNALDVITIKGTEYRVMDFISPIGKTDIQVKVVLSCEVKKDNSIIPIFLISTDISLTPEEIILYYLMLRFNNVTTEF